MTTLAELIEDLKAQADNPDTAAWVKITLKSAYVVCQQLQLANMQIQQNCDELKRENERLDYIRNQEETRCAMDDFFGQY